MADIQIGIIGGSGLYKMSALTDIVEVELDTPFGKPSDALVQGKLEGVPVVFLARHGRSHTYLPTEVPYRANIYALKSLGVKYILSVSAVGSLQESAKPLDILIPDQFIDRTKHRQDTFFGHGVVAHVTFAEPVCPALANLLAIAAESLSLEGITIHRGGVYLCMEGPAFSTKAESLLYRSWGAQVIGMTNVTEAKLAREAEIAYATLALITDYDCWHETHASVTVDMVLSNLQKNVANAQKIIQTAVCLIAENPPQSSAHRALEHAILTDLSALSPEAKARIKQRLGVIIEKYLIS
jgi:5'-methylthioadenosine phosphorylase